MTKNLKKCLSLLRAGLPITEARFPTNYQSAMEKEGLETDEVEGLQDAQNSYKPGEFAALAEAGQLIVGLGLTEVEFHQAHSVEKEQV